MTTIITKGKEGLFYATDPSQVGLLVAAHTIEDAYERVGLAIDLLEAEGRGLPMEGHDILSTDGGILITVPHSSWQTRGQRQETRSILVRLISSLPPPQYQNKDKGREPEPVYRPMHVPVRTPVHQRAYRTA